MEIGRRPERQEGGARGEAQIGRAGAPLWKGAAGGAGALDEAEHLPRLFRIIRMLRLIGPCTWTARRGARAVAAGSALASQHCLSIHLEAAIKAGANDDEILESVLIGSFMAMTRSQSVALRMFQDMHDSLEQKE